jgi:hypothetical protein
MACHEHVDFIGIIDHLLDPQSHIVEENAHFHRDLPGVDPNIAFAGAIISGSFPDICEHAPMKVLDEFFVEQIFRSLTHRPFLAARDILLLRSVEIAAKGNMGRNKVALFFR